MPGGDSIVISFAISSVSFLKVCKTFGGILMKKAGY
jgi:hypothetical protein